MFKRGFSIIFLTENYSFSLMRLSGKIFYVWKIAGFEREKCGKLILLLKFRQGLACFNLVFFLAKGGADLGNLAFGSVLDFQRPIFNLSNFNENFRNMHL